MSLTIFNSTFTYLLYILSLVLSLVAECARKKPAPSSATSESTSRESSASAKKRDTKKGSHEPSGTRQTPKGIDSNDVAQKKAETPAEAKKELPAKSVMKPAAAKAKEAEKGEAPPREELKTVARPLGKDGGEGAVTAADGADFIDFQGSKPVSMVLSESRLFLSAHVPLRWMLRVWYFIEIRRKTSSWRRFLPPEHKQEKGYLCP
ncbi:hypothetical protein GCK32_021635 [Trichostrongylus colubriformis]|uniref:Uncharacterized protein n=1 Tax=Trichostrongylus colubriformis TaxID=6319 RepID=A0AAN8FT34_TRICO